MASISKRRYWADPATGKEVPKGTPGAEQRESSHYRIRYVGTGGKVVSVQGPVDLREARKLAATLEAAVWREINAAPAAARAPSVSPEQVCTLLMALGEMQLQLVVGLGMVADRLRRLEREEARRNGLLWRPRLSA